MHAGDLNLRTNLHCSRQILTLAAAWSCAATSSTNAFNGVGCHHAPRRPRSNPHSARSTTACHFPRFPSLEAFGRRPQASVSAAPSVIGRHPKPFTEPAVSSCSKWTERLFSCDFPHYRGRPQRRRPSRYFFQRALVTSKWSAVNRLECCDGRLRIYRIVLDESHLDQGLRASAESHLPASRWDGG
jgi:hypothetical protein